jgi:hypothetical protein
MNEKAGWKMVYEYSSTIGTIIIAAILLWYVIKTNMFRRENILRMASDSNKEDEIHSDSPTSKNKQLL